MIKYIKIFIITAMFSILTQSCILSYGIKKYNLSSVDVETIKRKLKENYGNIHSLSGKFDFSFSTKTDRFQSSGYLYYSVPDSFYLRINGAVGETEAIFYFRGDSVFARNYHENFEIYDSSDKSELSRFIGMNISADKLFNALYGYEKLYNHNAVKDRTENKIVLISSKDENTYKIIELNENLLITKTTDYVKGKKDISCEFDYFKSEKGFVIPKRIRIRKDKPRSKLTLFYKSFSINKYYKINTDFINYKQKEVSAEGNGK